MAYAFAYEDVDELTRQRDDARDAQEKALKTLGVKLNALAESGCDFGQLFGLAQDILRLDDLKMSRLLKVSRPTIGRWARGVSTPHPLAREAIIAALVREARDQSKSL
jgi:hypothetical protein